MPTNAPSSTASIIFGMLLGIFGSWQIARCQSPYPTTGAYVASAPNVAARKPAAPGQIDVAKSRVYVHVDKTGFGHEHGVEGLVKSGSFHLGATQNAGAIEIDTASFTADSDEARRYVGLEGSTAPDTRTEVTNNMLGPACSTSSNFPLPRSSSIPLNAYRPSALTAPQQYQLEGSFTLHGKTQRITILD